MASDNKSVKGALKKARESIDARDYKAALGCCKKALNVDKNNYLALVFCGLCLTELKQTEQAVQAYKRAVDADAGQLQGWQGLAKIYEGMINATEPNVRDKLLYLDHVYDKMAEIHAKAKDVDKLIAVTSKQSTLLSTRLHDISKCVDVMRKRIEFINSTDKMEEVNKSYSEMIRLMNQYSQTSELNGEQNEVLTDALEKVLNEGGSIQNMDNFKIYLRLMYKIRRMVKLGRGALMMTRAFTNSPIPLEWLCKLYLEWAADTLIDPEDQEDYKDIFSSLEHIILQLLELNPTSNLGTLAKHVYHFRSSPDQIVAEEVRKSLHNLLIEKKTNNFYALFILCQCCLVVGDDLGLETAINQCLLLINEKVKEENTRRRMGEKLNLMKIECLYRQSKYSKALEVLDGGCSNAIESKSLKLIKAKILANTGRRRDVEKFLVDLEEDQASLLEAILLKTEGSADKALKIIQKRSDKSFEAKLLEGQILWDMDRYADSLPCFLIAAKANPNSWIAFMHLGKFYSAPGAKQDLEKAVKCLKKSLQLNPTSSEAGALLSDIFRSQGQWEQNLQFLSSMTTDKKSEESSWAHLRMGMHYLAKEEYSMAITSLQIVLRVEPDNINALESLGDAYYARGSFATALKAYETVLEKLRESGLCQNNDDKLYARLQIATINYKLGHFDESIRQLRDILLTEKDYVPAVKILAESLLAQARLFIDQFLDKNAVDNCQTALAYISAAVANTRKDLACLWKLMADSCLLLSDIAEDIAYLTVPDVLLSNYNVPADKLTILNLGVKLCARAIQIESENANFWHDLAFGYHSLVKEMKRKKVANAELIEDVEKKCLIASKRSISIDPRNVEHWNALGVFLMLKTKPIDADRALAQHAFLKSIQVDNNAVAWTNLGVLYLLLGDIELSNNAFKEAKSQEPVYINGWVGQAILAESQGQEVESLDMFRHTTFLGNQVESAVGYARWICRTISGMALLKAPSQPTDHGEYCVKKMYGVTVATDCLLRYCTRIKDDPASLNMLGVLLDRENVPKAAEDAFVRALASTASQDVDLILQNLARVLMKQGRFQDARDRYLKVGDRLDLQGQLGLSLCYWKLGDEDDAYESYRVAFDKAETDNQRSQILTAMAAVVSTEKSGVSKTLLFRASQLHPPSINGLFCLCVLGMKSSDPTLINAALGEMEKYQKNDPNDDVESHIAEITKLKCLVLTLKGDKDGAKKVLCSAIHRYPYLAGLWATLSLHLLRNHGEPVIASKCAQKAMECTKFATVNPGVSLMETQRYMESRNELSSLAALCQMLSPGNSKDACTSASKAVHEYPSSPVAWSVLAAAVNEARSKFSNKLRLKLLENTKLVASKSTDSLAKSIETWAVLLINGQRWK